MRIVLDIEKHHVIVLLMAAVMLSATGIVMATPRELEGSEPAPTGNPDVVQGHPVYEVDLSAGAEQELDMNENRIINLQTPSADQDAVTKAYMDGEVGDIEDSYVEKWEVWDSDFLIKAESGDIGFGSDGIADWGDADMNFRVHSERATWYADQNRVEEGWQFRIHDDGSDFTTKFRVNSDGDVIIPEGELDMSWSNIVRVAWPEHPEDAATKAYVDHVCDDDNDDDNDDDDWVFYPCDTDSDCESAFGDDYPYCVCDNPSVCSRSTDVKCPQ